MGERQWTADVGRGRGRGREYDQCSIRDDGDRGRTSTTSQVVLTTVRMGVSMIAGLE